MNSSASGSDPRRSRGEEDSVGVAQVLAAVWLFDRMPFGSDERMLVPTCTGESKVCVPSEAYPIQFETLNLELRGRIFQVIA
jgi:hypothetical protein